MRFVVCALIVGASTVGTAQTGRISPRDRELWTKEVTPLLARPLWNENGSRYNAPNLLMLPLHAAFKLEIRAWQLQFVNHFARFSQSSPPDTFPAAYELGWLQYDYLASQFLVLSARAGAPVDERLSILLGKQISALWTSRPAWQWAEPAFRGIRARVAWKLATRSTPKSYYRAIVDHEEFVFAIAADLSQYQRLTGAQTISPALSKEILETAKEVYAQRVVWQSDGGWLFQPGVWVDHPDYRYVKQSRKVAGMAPAPSNDVAEDVSHSFRLPLWLVSLRDAATDSSESRNYSDLLKGLESQFFAHVLVRPTPAFPAYRLTNWMDGRNGVYRWNYSARGATWGYGPYQLSATFTLGWWAFLGTKRIRDAYADEAAHFPLSATVLAGYFPDLSRVDAVPSVTPDPIMDFRELNVRLASMLEDERPTMLKRSSMQGFVTP
jgi:hypothetical protein